MKVCKIKDLVFKELIDGVKHCVCKDGARKSLQFIQILVKEKSVVFIALDGYRAGRTETSQENTECFTCFIKPFSYKPLGKPSDVIVEFDGQTAWVEFETEYGKLRYAFEQPDETSVDMEKVYENARPHDDEIGANGRYIAQACNAIARLNRRHGTVVIEKRKSAEQAFILRGKNELIKNEQLILPIRMSGED